jgi:hypothetical protein
VLSPKSGGIVALDGAEILKRVRHVDPTNQRNVKAAELAKIHNMAAPLTHFQITPQAHHPHRSSACGCDRYGSALVLAVWRARLKA